MAVYARKTTVANTSQPYAANNNTDVLTPTEYPIYGSARLGNYMPQADNNTQAVYTLQSNFVRNYLAPTFNQNTKNAYLNSRNYELNDHLGNVTATVSDYKTNQKVQLLTAHVYYPFGMEIQSRSAGNYRFGFNGKEIDPEGMGGGGSTYDYGFRIYNPQLAKFLSVDPLTKSYPMLTPYQFASNSPISGIDLDGLEYFYAADGTLLGKMGTSTEVRLVENKEVLTTQNTLAKINGVESKMNYVKKDFGLNICEIFIYKKQVESVMSTSQPVGLTNEELNTRAFLSTITELEDGAYNKKIGGEVFEGDEHPGGKILRFGTEYKYASAAGAYQFTEETAEEFQKKAGVDDFSPKSQDAMAVALIKEKKALDYVKKGDIKSAFGKLFKRWSSMPGGKEPSKKDAYKVFKKSISRELKNDSPIKTPKGELKL